ncbi:MAG TPA: carbamoyltransferase HypF [Terriglobales bacterium]|nr:carbamoyltransferase HypF [Terriglobales bacterium]
MPTLPPPSLVAREIRIRGVVQGVGFRPFVYHLARSIGLRGFVRNSSSGVTIAIEGPEEAVARFLDELRQNPPPLARIEECAVAVLAPSGAAEFVIHESRAEPGEFALVSPDVALCADCRREILDPADRRFAYPFTNCTNCGPRYTIIQDIPYDRPATTMAGFRMCPQCEAEYHDPANRRFHAQPNACPRCGPSLTLHATTAGGRSTATGSHGDEIGGRSTSTGNHGDGTGGRSTSTGDTPTNSLAILRDVRAMLRQGQIVAIKGLGGFHLACDAGNAAAVELLRSRKKRSDKPFALMARDVAAVELFCHVSDAERQLLESREKPIVILRRKSSAGIPPAGPYGCAVEIPAAVAPGNRTLGVMLPYTPLHLFLFGEDTSQPPEFTALVMTSGNISDEPIVISNDEAGRRLAGIADTFVTHNRDIYMRVDDPVARVFAGQSRVLRRSRGYAPEPIDLGTTVGELLACGAELKNTFCLTKGHYAILSQHIGDVENYETLEFFRETLGNLKKLFRVQPQAVAHDLHPHYLTTRLALEQPLPKFAVQHHHAHIAACMAENHVTGTVIGVAFDGTGYGTDGQIWGGEFLVAGYGAFERRAHFRYVPLPGGDTAVRQTWRPALSWLRETFGSQMPAGLTFLESLPHKEAAIVERMMERRLNTVLTSSCGRLFDAVAALLGMRSEANFEGQAAIELEMACAPGVEEAYEFEIEAGTPAPIDFRPLIRGIVRDLQAGDSRHAIASRFHNTIAAVIVEVCRRIRDADRLQRVCLSGGTFQNVYLLERAVRLLRAGDFEVFLHSAVPPNDGGIALGQAVIANAMLQGA